MTLCTVGVGVVKTTRVTHVLQYVAHCIFIAACLFVIFHGLNAPILVPYISIGPGTMVYAYNCTL